MKVLQVNQNISVNGGGVTRMIREFTPALRKQGHEVYAATPEKDDESLRWLNGYFQINGLGTGAAPSVEEIREVIETVKIDVVHVHEVRDIELLHYLDGVIPTIVHLHNYSWWCPGTELFYRKTNDICSLSTGMHCVVRALTMNCCNRHPLRLLPAVRNAYMLRRYYDSDIRFVTSSEYMRRRGVGAGIPREKTFVVPYAVRGDRFDAGKLEKHRPVSDRYILYVGRLAQSKGVEYLLEALGRLELPDVKLLIVGDGIHRGRLQQMISDLGLSSRVVMAGWLDNEELAAAYLGAELLVVPSIWAEVFGIVGLEAMAASKPVVAFDVGGISQWLEDGKTGYLVPRQNADALTEAVHTLLVDKQLALEMGARGRHAFERKFSVDAVVADLVSAYDRVVADTKVNSSR